MAESKCRICGNIEHNQLFNISEMRFGMGDTFTYFKCSSCGCLQIQEYPSNIADYYPSEYYSFTSKLKAVKSKGLKRFLLSKVAHQVTGKRPSLAGRILVRRFGGGTVEKIRGSKAGFSQRILEVGCGSGNNLVRLYKYGFRDLTGVDPFIDDDIIYNDQVKVFKRRIFDLHDQEYDLIFLSHSFEHMPDQHQVLEELSGLITDKGQIMIAVPVIDSYAWRRFGINWVGLCAPRHFYLHSVKSMKTLCSKAGLEIEHIDYKTSAFDFWGSEQYALGIPLQHEDSLYRKKSNDRFSRKAIQGFEQFASKLDQARDGSTALFYLKKK